MKLLTVRCNTDLRRRGSFCARVLATWALAFIVIGVAKPASALPTPIVNCGFVIQVPGEYRLEADLLPCQAFGVSIQVNDVHLDLNGHTILGPFLAAGQCGSTPTNPVGISVTASDVHIDGNTRDPGHRGIVQGFQTGILFQNRGTPHDTGDNHASHISVTRNCLGIFLQRTDYNHVDANTVTGNFTVGVLLSGANYNAVSSNIVTNSGVLCCGNAAVNVTDLSLGNSISRNEISNNNAWGLRLSSSNENLVVENSVTNNLMDGIGVVGVTLGNNHTRSERNVIRGNVASRNSQDMSDDNTAVNPTACLNTWKGNTFSTDNEHDGPGAGCIR